MGKALLDIDSSLTASKTQAGATVQENFIKILDKMLYEEKV